MTREWYLIDDDGVHPVNAGGDPEDFWERFDRDGDQSPWPPFNQLVVDVPAQRAIEHLIAAGAGLDVEFQEVTDRPERWEGAVVVADAGSLAVIGEPGVSLDDRVIALPCSKRLVGRLECDGAFFGYDPSADTLHLTRFSDGTVEFAWADSLVPGPSYAMVFDDNGEATDEDPRRFALRRLNIPETSPLLDRYRFITEELRRLGVEEIRPQMDQLPVAAVLAARVIQNATNDRGG